MLDQQNKQSNHLQDLSKDLSKLKIKVAGVSGLFGLIGAYIKTKIDLQEVHNGSN